MVSWHIVKMLAAAFTPDLNITNSTKFLNVAVELLSDRLDGETVMLPIPQDAPADIPRIQLASADKKWRLGISLQQTNLFYQPPIKDSGMLDINDFALIASEFFSNYQKKMDLRVQRLALVTDRICPEDTAPRYIIEKFCKEEYYEQRGRPFFNVRAFQVHSLKRYSWEGFSLNSWVRFLSAHYDKNGEKNVPAIMLENDLNTIPYEQDPDREFSSQDIERFFLKISNHLKEILDLYSV